jgi:acyl-coenzyme A thioesterase PaaI-like protein
MSKEIEYLPHSSGCFLCGEENTCGVQARFFVEGDTVRARVSLPNHLNGYKNIAHGGVIAGLLDETMGWAATVFGKKQPVPPFYVTGELSIKYLAPVPVGKEIEIRSRLVKDGGRIAFGEGELLYDARVYVRAKGKFIPMTY